MQRRPNANELLRHDTTVAVEVSMSARRRPATLALFVTVFMAWEGAAYAQAPSPATPASTWTIGVSAGLWDRVPTDRENGRHNGTAVEASVQRRLGSAHDAGAPAIRVQVGTGSGTGAGQPGFNYTRLMVGVVGPFTGASRPPFAVYVAAGGGAYALTSPGARSTKASVYGALGLDVSLGSSPASISAEVQMHAIGTGVFATTSLGARIHFR
jgi:hypothetical protein